MTLQSTEAVSLAERIRELLGKGLSGSVVASAVGCDPSYITQLMEDEDFKQKVLELRASGAEAAIGRDDRWDRIEEAALAKMELVLPMVHRASDLIKIAQMANAAKRSARELAAGNESTAPIVQLILPASAIIHFQMNSQAQVVEVDGRSTAPLPTRILQERLKERTQRVLSDESVQQVHIPAATLTERKKIVSTLEAIGFSEDAPEVQKVLA